MRTIVGVGILLTIAGFSQAKDRDWQRGLILDAQSSRQRVATGAVTTGTISPDSGGGSTITANTRITHAELSDTQLMIEGDEYAYVIEKQTSRTWDDKPGLVLASAIASLRQHSCRFVVGDGVRYAQNKGKLYAIDADGRECKLTIIRQERAHR